MAADTISGPLNDTAEVFSAIEHNLPRPKSVPPSVIDNILERHQAQEIGSDKQYCEFHAIQKEDFAVFGIAAQNVAAQQAILEELREQALLLRDQVRYERDEYAQRSRFMMDSSRKAAVNLSMLPDRITISDLSARVKLHSEELVRDQRQLEDQGSKLARLENALSNIEYQMQLEEARLGHEAHHAANAAQKMKIDLPFVPEADTRFVKNQEHAAGGRPDSPDVHPLLQEYYDQFGEAKIIQGRIVELNSNYNEAQTRRMLDEDQGRGLDPNAVVEEYWARESDRLQVALRLTIEAAEKARSACIAAGLDPDGYKNDMEDSANIESRIPEPFSSVEQDVQNDVAEAPQDQKLVFARPNFPDMPNPPAIANIEPSSRSQSPENDTLSRSHEWVCEWVKSVQPVNLDDDIQEKLETPGLPHQRSLSMSSWQHLRNTAPKTWHANDAGFVHPLPRHSRAYKGTESALPRHRSSDSEMYLKKLGTRSKPCLQ